MQTYILLKKYNLDFIFFLPTQKNKILDNSYYIKIIYSNQSLTLNGIYYYVEIPYTKIVNKFNKYYLYFNKKDLANYDNICEIENQLLNKYSSNKSKELSLKKQLDSEEFVFYTNSFKEEPTIKFIIKISGLWENKEEIGITHKLIYINRQLLQNHP